MVMDVLNVRMKTTRPDPGWCGHFLAVILRPVRGPMNP
jgi:hypothetical protein